GEQRLAGARAVDRDANAWRGERTHHLAALDLRQEHRPAAVENRQIDGLAALLHETAHARPGDLEQIARLDKGAAHDERLNADGPVSRLGVAAHVALLLEGGQQPMRRREGQTTLLTEVAEGNAAGALGQAVEQRKSAPERLNQPRPADLSRGTGAALRDPLYRLLVGRCGHRSLPPLRGRALRRVAGRGRGGPRRLARQQG